MIGVPVNVHTDSNIFQPVAKGWTLRTLRWKISVGKFCGGFCQPPPKNYFAKIVIIFGKIAADFGKLQPCSSAGIYQNGWNFAKNPLQFFKIYHNFGKTTFKKISHRIFQPKFSIVSQNPCSKWLAQCSSYLYFGRKYR